MSDPTASRTNDLASLLQGFFTNKLMRQRQALEKANSATTHNPFPAPLWHDRHDIIQRLCGLKQ